MDLALQPVRRKLHAKPVPLNLAICALRTSVDSAPSLFLRIARQYRYRRPASTALTPAMQSAPPLSTFRINTCKSVSKQRTLTSFRMNTCEKGGGGGVSAYGMRRSCRRFRGATTFHLALKGVTLRPPRPLPLPPAFPAKSGCSPAPCSLPAGSTRKIPRAPAPPSPTPQCLSHRSACAPRRSALRLPWPAPPQYSESSAPSAHTRRPRQQSFRPARWLSF